MWSGRLDVYATSHKNNLQPWYVVRFTMARLARPKNSSKKLAVILVDGTRIEFGQAGASDFTQHKDLARRSRYLARHAPNETWSAKGVRSPGFWARWLLWNKPTLEGSMTDIKARFGDL